MLIASIFRVMSKPRMKNWVEIWELVDEGRSSAGPIVKGLGPGEERERPREPMWNGGTAARPTVYKVVRTTDSTPHSYIPN